MSNDAVSAIELTDVPPSMMPALNVVLGDAGTRRSAMCASARPSAWMGLGMPNAP